jgi:hypothetical protein
MYASLVSSDQVETEENPGPKALQNTSRSASVGNICNTRAYREFVLTNHLFNARTEKGNMTFSTTAESVTGFLSGNLTDEPHTSLEDIIGYELPTLVHIAKKAKWREKITTYSWNAHQVNQHFKVK